MHKMSFRLRRPITRLSDARVQECCIFSMAGEPERVVKCSILCTAASPSTRSPHSRVYQSRDHGEGGSCTMCVCVCVHAYFRVRRQTYVFRHSSCTHARSDVGGGISGVYNQYYNVRVKKRIIIKEKQTNNRNTIEPSPRLTASSTAAAATTTLLPRSRTITTPSATADVESRFRFNYIHIYTTVAIYHCHCRSLLYYCCRTVYMKQYTTNRLR